jgi:type I restriction enzyme S subunit
MSWPAVDFTDVLKDVSGGNIKTKQNEYADAGKFPIVDQGQSLIGGFTNDESRLCKTSSPVIVFGDHTKALKFVDFPFCMGADGTKILQAIDGNDPKYLYYALHNVHIPEAGYSRHFKYLKAGKIPLPPLEEQKRIAGVLDQADALRRLRTTALDKLNTLGQAIFHEMFGAAFQISDLSTSQPLGNYLTSVTNGMTRRAKTGDLETDIVLRLKDVREGEIIFSDPGRIALTEKEKTKYTVKTGDLLFIRVNGNPEYVGRNAVFSGHNETVFFNDHVMRVEVDRKIVCPVFLSFVLNSPFGKRQIKKNRKTSAGQHTINQAGLSSIRIPFPEVQFQHKFRDHLGAITSRTEEQRRQVRALDKLFASLQYRAFRGEL